MPTGRAACCGKWGWNNNRDMTNMNKTPRWITNSGWLLIAAYVLILPFKHLFEFPVALMALAGLWLLVTQTRTVAASPAFKPLLVMSACIVLPMACSLPDAVNFSRAAQTTLSFLRFPLAAIFVLFALQAPLARQRLWQTLGVALSFVAISSVLRIGLGSPALQSAGFVGQFINAVGDQRAVGHVLAVLSVTYFFWLWQLRDKLRWSWILAPIYVAAILLSGARVAWIMLLVSSLLFAAYLIVLMKVRLQWKPVLIQAAVWLAVVLGALQQPALHSKMQVTAGLFSGKYEQTNTATSQRLPIWLVAVNVAKTHWVNGIGPRGFRYVYADYAAPDDFFRNLNPPQSPTHPHQQFLEIAAETGIIGVIGYLFALGYWLRLSWVAVRARATQALPWMLAVLIAIMPINAHMAFYASFWSCMTWWLVALSLAFWQLSLAEQARKT